MQLPGAKLESLKQQIYKQTVDPLFTYRDKVAKTAASGQLILPESLKLLPLYSLALIKTYAFRWLQIPFSLTLCFVEGLDI